MNDNFVWYPEYSSTSNECRGRKGILEKEFKNRVWSMYIIKNCDDNERVKLYQHNLNEPVIFRSREDFINSICKKYKDKIWEIENKIESLNADEGELEELIDYCEKNTDL